MGGSRDEVEVRECPAATNSSSEYMLQVVAVDVLIDISTLRALVAIGSVKAELYFLDSVGSVKCRWFFGRVFSFPLVEEFV